MAKPKWVIYFFVNGYISTKLETDIESLARDFLVRLGLRPSKINQLFVKVGHSNSSEAGWKTKEGTNHRIVMEVEVIP